MPEIAVVNSKGTEVEKITLSSDIFDVCPSMPAMHSAVVAHLANLRTGTAETRTRSLVRGGGRKPYRQKGTGRARQGSIRAPHFVGGGVVFGPHPRDYDKHLQKKMRRLAIKSAFAARFADGDIIVVDELRQDAISTKTFVNTLSQMGLSGKVLLIMSEPDDIIRKSVRNVPAITLRIAPSVSTYDLLNADKILLTKAAVAKIEEAHA
jgi:large subunit ribosomal protein L4